MLFGRNAQEAGDFCLISRRAAEASQTPFFNVQDGFLTTHTVETVRLPEPEFMKEFIGDPKEKLINLMDPANPVMSGVVQNQDSYMKGKIAQRWYYDRVEPGPGGSLRDVLPQDGPASTISSNPIAARTPSTSWSAWAATWRRPRRPSIICASKGIAAGCLTVFVFRPFPASQIVEALERLQGVHRLRAHGRSAVHDRQSPDARDQGGLLRRDQRPERPATRSTEFRGSTAARPAWAAATCGPATSSPPSTT